MSERPAAIQDLLPAYRRWLKAEKRRPDGIDKYLHTMRQVSVWLGEKATLADLTEKAVRRYREYLADNDLSASTIGNHLSVIRSFCKWAMEEELRTDDPTWRQRWPAKVETDPEALTEDELQLLLHAISSPLAQDDETVWYWQRNRLAILTMLYTGLRISEMAALHYRDVQFLERRVVVRDGKFGKSRSIPIHSNLLSLLLAVPAVDRIPGKAVVAQRENGLPLTTKSLANVFVIWLPRYGVEIHAHQLRHTFASQLLRNGANIKEIQELLGHKRLDTTQRYLRLDERQKRAAIERLPSFVR
jgi:site-specific recombinase XerD